MDWWHGHRLPWDGGKDNNKARPLLENIARSGRQAHPQNVVFPPFSGGSILFRRAGLNLSHHGWEMPKEAAGRDAYMPLSRRGRWWNPAGTSASVLSFPGAIRTLGGRVSPECIAREVGRWTGGGKSLVPRLRARLATVFTPLFLRTAPPGLGPDGEVERQRQGRYIRDR